jgi:hypothetical protein
MHTHTKQCTIKKKKETDKRKKNSNNHNSKLNYYRADDGNTCVVNPVVLVTVKF